jgi:alcohol dehydrogenase
MAEEPRTMRALLFEGPGVIAYREDVPDPQIQDPTDAVIAVRASGLCGSDLHPHAGREPARPGVVPGHEAVGEVLAVGGAVARFTVGDRVLVPFTTSCGTCGACQRGLSARCERGQLLGWGDPDDLDRPAVHGAQAERLRVPLADGTLVRVPEGVGDLEALLLTDNLPTGWAAVERLRPTEGEPLGVVGLGAVGLCAVAAARALGADPVLGVDPVASRRAQAERLGALAADPRDAEEAVAAILGGDGVGRLPAVVDAAGTPSAQRLALALLRPGGGLSVIAVPTQDGFAFTPVEAYDRNLAVHLGRAPVRSLLDRLLPRVADGTLTVPAEVVLTHAGVPLSEGPEVYRRFAAREPGLTKVAFDPSC